MSAPLFTETIPAEFAAVFTEPARQGRAGTIPGGQARIFVCAWHLPQAIRVLAANAGGVITIEAANPAVHGCKGHLDSWPVPVSP